MQQGQTVRIKKGYENCPEELDMTYTIIEVLGDQAYIQPMNCTMAIVPTELVGTDMIELA
jgi:hypothetical protein